MRRSRKPLGGLPPSRGFESLPLRQKYCLTSGFSVGSEGRWSVFRPLPWESEVGDEYGPSPQLWERLAEYVAASVKSLAPDTV